MVAKNIRRKTAVPAPTPAPTLETARRTLAVTIDFPRSGDVVRTGHYAVRVSATGLDQVQVRVGSGEWTDTRESCGFRWYDWSPAVGPARLEARARRGKGRWTVSPQRDCVVIG